MKILNHIITLTMLASLLNLSACKPKSDEKKPTRASEMSDEQFKKSIEDFKNRTIHKSLTAEIIDTTADADLVQLIFDNLSTKLPEDYRQEYPTVMSWNKSRQAVYLIWLLEAEVNNGGFNQFYANSSGEFYKSIPDALKLVGAVKFADLAQRANNTYEKEYKKITKHQDGSLEGFSKSYEDNPLEKFDDEFYDLDDEDLLDLQIAYIRKHKADFIDQ